MKEPWLISDPHFFHVNICKWEGARPYDCHEHMSYDMRDKWNAVVQAEDKVLILGDVFNRLAIDFLKQLNGRKTLIMGNHDQARPEVYLEAGVEKLLGSYEISDGILTHIPVHPNQLTRWKWNGHGHMHNHEVLLDNGRIDPRYISLCVEHWEYAPAKLSDVLNRLRKRGLNPLRSPEDSQKL